MSITAGLGAGTRSVRTSAAAFCGAVNLLAWPGRMACILELSCHGDMLRYAFSSMLQLLMTSTAG